MNVRTGTAIFWFLIMFILGWSTQALSVFDVGRYSFPLILFAGLPFCIRMTYRSSLFLVLPIVSTFFSVLVGLLEGAQVSHIISQTALQGLAITFAAGVASINWNEHLDALENSIIIMGVPIVVYACYQMLARVAHLPGAFLPVTNKQYYVEGGLQRDWNKADVTRSSSIFSEPSELGFYCLWLFVIGLSTKNKKLRIISLLLGSVGVLVSQSLSAVLGVVAIFVGYFVIQGISRQLIRHVFLMAVMFTAVVLALNTIAPEAFGRFSERIVEAVFLDERADSGRVDHLPACFELIKASPVWGYGISSLAAADSNGSDVTTVNYVMVLMERGIVGAVLFFIPWFSITVRAWLLPRNASGRTLAFLLLVMTLCSFCNFSLTYFLPYWLALGISASFVLQTYATPVRKELSQLSQPSYGSLTNHMASGI